MGFNSQSEHCEMKGEPEKRKKSLGELIKAGQVT